MHILIIGIGNPPPFFIYRRLELLVQYGVDLTVVVQEHQVLDIDKVKVIRLPGSFSIIGYFKSIFLALFNPGAFFKLLSLSEGKGFARKLLWSLKHVPILQAAHPDVIHIQWLGSVAPFLWLKNFYSSPVMASARGSQITIYPFTRPGYSDTMRKAMQESTYIHCVSKDLEQACMNLGAKKNQIVVNYNGINLQQFSLPEKPSEHAFLTLVSVGVFMWRKGFLYQLQILHKVLLSGYKTRLLWVAYGPDREGLEYVSYRMGLKDQVIFAGESAIQDVPSWLHQADIYISTSVSEGLSNSVVEAAACGLPIVTFECEGMDEIVENGVNGFIIPFGDVDAMVQKIIYMANHPDERRKMGLASRKIAEERFDENKWVLHMIETYKSIARNK
ncbi:MAG: glycosyltransferase family 4 protein [Chitinophagales bacterium]|nr:glycosyltransferase family 4 protein [Chitinophagales bacterium]